MYSRNTKKEVFTLAALAALVVSAPLARGEAMHSMQALSDGAIWAQSFSNSMWMTANMGGNTYAGSAVALDPWNVLVAGHEVYEVASGGFATNILVGLGDNYLTNQGAMYTPADYVIHPGWDGSLFSQRVDLAMLHFPQGIPGMSTLDIAGSSLTQQLNGAGHGRPAVAQNWLPSDGQERAYNWYVDDYGVPGVVSTDYIRSRFLQMQLRSDPMAGGLTPGDSGMGVFDTSGGLVGLGVGYGSAMPLYNYSSYALRLDLYESWIDQNRIVPEPGTFGLLAIGGIALLRRRR